MQPVKLVERATSTAVHALRHPVSSAAYATGLARGLAGAVFHGATERLHDHQTGPAPIPTQRTTSAQPSSGVPEPQRVPKPVPAPEDLAEPVVIEPRDDDPGESFATEPKATSRQSEHGGRRASDAEIDAWIDEAMAGRPEVAVETSVGTTGADVDSDPHTGEADPQQHVTEPLLDPATAKAIRSETEMLRKDAERNPE
jgi:hypothetical protein